MKKQILLTAISTCAPLILGVSSTFADTSTPVTANFTVSQTDNNNPTPPSPIDPANPDQGGNKPLTPSGTFALSYLPSTFNFGTTDLTGKTEVNVNANTVANKTFNVGIKNTTHTDTGWTLSATLNGNLAQYGANIKTGISNDSIKVNNNGTLEALPAQNMITATNNATINSSSSVIVKGNSGSKVFSGTYDVNLGQVTLNIPDVSSVPAGQIAGSVNWDLQKVPSQN